MKQETLEEAALDYSGYEEHRMDFIAGAKWQKEQDKNLYSEEEAKKLIVDFLFTKGIGKEVGSVNDWFEQFKNK